MAQILEAYDYMFNQRADPRVRDWPLMSSPFPIVALVVFYLYAVLSWGPKYMSTRKAYSLKGVIAVYNIGQVLACTVLVYQLLITAWLNGYTLGCQEVDYSDDPTAVKIAGLLWWTTLLKMSEFIETVFFVLRKKTNQVSFLHLYHHISTMTFAWIGTKYVAGGMSTFSVVINCVVHILMYTYYLLSLYPNIQRRIAKWKNYLTIIQMLQFCMIVGHSMQALRSDCSIPNWAAYMYIPNIFIVFYLFYDFYTVTYLIPKRGKTL